MDRERFRFVAARREVSHAAGHRQGPSRHVLARRTPVVEQDEEGGLPAHLDGRLAQPPGHAKPAPGRRVTAPSSTRSHAWPWPLARLRFAARSLRRRGRTDRCATSRHRPSSGLGGLVAAMDAPHGNPRLSGGHDTARAWAHKQCRPFAAHNSPVTDLDPHFRRAEGSPNVHSRVTLSRALSMAAVRREAGVQRTVRGLTGSRRLATMLRSQAVSSVPATELRSKMAAT